MNLIKMIPLGAVLCVAPLFAEQETEQPEVVSVAPIEEVSDYPRCHEKIEPKFLPFFPHVMAIDSTSGEVKLRFVITKEGQTENIEILESSGGRNERAFRSSALRTAENWEYDPIRESCVHIDTIEYHLGDA
ncbi:MAG TPA: hypothetical protein DCM54_01200 [Gammaproteobacteria bacterium]|nr:hypothetical protein [Gammaproteobacteria bacterium]|tara:strand:+ start:923 stop:1318 length:396 start_codon:yes stop_codon:yes gene_type:complete